MEKELVKLLLEKDYTELSPSERVALREWCSGEEEFEHLKSVIQGVDQIRMVRQFAPRPEVKSSLDALFEQRHAKQAPMLWYNSIMLALYPKDKPLTHRPLLQLAAVTLLLIIVYPFLFNSEIVEKKQQVAQVEEQKESIQTDKELTTEHTDKDYSAPSVESEVVEDFVVESDEVSVDQIVAMNSSEGIISLDEPTAGVTYSWRTAPGEVSTHPDGIYLGESAVSYSQSAATQPAVFDLLTVTF
ncbi:MAG: hypothetical protein ACK457_07490 [Flavobacteriia bacterium]|jgi:hypothetical protein